MHRMRMARNPVLRNLGALTVAVLLLVMGLSVSAQVADNLVSALVGADPALLEFMHQFVQEVDAAETAEDHAALLENMTAWFEDRGVDLGDGMLWAVDETKVTDDGDPWLATSPIRGESAVQTVGVVLTARRLSLFIRIAAENPSTGDVPGDLTQQALAAISWRSDDGWHGLLSLVLDANAPSAVDERDQLFSETRETLVRKDEAISAGVAELSVCLHAGAEAAGALYFGPVPEGMVRTPQAITVFGETIRLVYNRLF